MKRPARLLRKPPELAPLCVWIVSLLGAAHAPAGVVQWSNTNGGAFSAGANWIGGVVPAAGDFAHFGRTRDPNQQAAYTVSFSASPSNLGVVVEDDAVTFDLNGNFHSLTSPLAAISVGTSTSVAGRLTLTDGVVATAPDAPVQIGGSSGAPGVLTLSTGAQLLGPSVQVGSAGPGTLVVQNGADLVGGSMFLGSQSTPAFNGAAAVTGAGSSLVVENLIVGFAGEGTLGINAGGRAESIFGTIGGLSGVRGTVNVDGAGSTWTCSESLLIGGGNQSRGVLNLTGGAGVRCLDAEVGASLGGSGTVNVDTNATLTVLGDLIAGNESTGSITIAGGGLVQSASTSIGALARGSLSILGPGSLLNCSTELTVGGTGTGAMSITAGGQARCADGFIGRNRGRGDVVVSGTGSTWTISGDLSVGGDVTFPHAGAGSLTIGAGGAVTADGVFILSEGAVELAGGTLEASLIRPVFGPGGVFHFVSGVLHANRIDLALVNEGGTLAPGRPAGRTTITGGYTQLAPAALEIELGGPTPATQFDQVLVEGAASVDGTLSLHLINGFAPAQGQTFVVVETTAGIAGSFANAPNGHRVVTSDGSGSFAVHYGAGSEFDPTKVVLADFRPCTADYNADGVVDFFDYLDFVQDFAVEDPAADVNGDGQVDFFDYLDFVTALDSGC